MHIYMGTPKHTHASWKSLVMELSATIILGAQEGFENKKEWS